MTVEDVPLPGTTPDAPTAKKGRRMAEDKFDASNADGRIRMTLDGTAYVLKRPKIREFRKLRETLVEISKRAGATDEDAEAASRGKIDVATIVEREDEMLTWWAEVFGMLEEKGQPLPDPDDLPLWLLGPTIVPDVMNAWLSRPAHPGG